jgi:hypothetical protein
VKRNKCGQENKANAKFCNQPGPELEKKRNKNNNIFEILGQGKTTIRNLVLIKYKRISIIILVIVLISFAGFIGMLQQQKSSGINDIGSGSSETSSTGSPESDSKDTSLKIIKTEISFKASNKYQTVKITVQNNKQEDINYVKVGMHFKNSNGEVVQSDWTISDSVIKPGASQTIEKMVSKDIEYNTVDAEILDFE